LPSGMNTQRDTREETIIGQDASMLMEAMRGGARGMDDLTNYVYTITNYYTEFDNQGMVVNQGYYSTHGYSGYNAYTHNSAISTFGGAVTTLPAMPITNGLRIIGLLSTPEFTGGAGGGEAVPNVIFGGTSNYVTAYVRSFSGLAAEKPPQDNQIMQEDTFSYRLHCVNAPVPTDTNFFQPLWQDQAYGSGSQVFYQWDFWQATANIPAAYGPPPGPNPSKWVKVPNYTLELLNSQRELRLLFSWPLLPNGKIGGFRQSFRDTVAGQLIRTNYGNYFPFINDLYFYESQSFTNAP
jgi:hypothetical protein